MTPSRRLIVWCFGLSLFACKREKAPTVVLAPSASPSSAPRTLTDEELSSPTAFELAASGDGLTLLWARASKDVGWLRGASLSQQGSLVGTPVSPSLPARALGKVTDLNASFVGDALAVAWVEQSATEARAEAAFLRGGVGAPLIDLGPAALSAESARGNLALVAEAERGRALTMWRGLSAPCEQAGDSQCTSFTFRRLAEDGAETTGLPLSVPAPCVAHSVQLVVSPGRFHYGVCTREGAEPTTTMFHIQYDPQYARADPMLRGCTPLATLVRGAEPFLVGDCHGKRRVVSLLEDKPRSIALDAPELRCTAERAVLSQGPFTLELHEPRAGLESVIPATWLPSGARAGWTGKSLVVVYRNGPRLESRTWLCKSGRLEPSAQ